MSRLIEPAYGYLYRKPIVVHGAFGRLDMSFVGDHTGSLVIRKKNDRIHEVRTYPRKADPTRLPPDKRLLCRSFIQKRFSLLGSYPSTNGATPAQRRDSEGSAQWRYGGSVGPSGSPNARSNSVCCASLGTQAGRRKPLRFGAPLASYVICMSPRTGSLRISYTNCEA